MTYETARYHSIKWDIEDLFINEYSEGDEIDTNDFFDWVDDNVG